MLDGPPTGHPANRYWNSAQKGKHMLADPPLWTIYRNCSRLGYYPVNPATTVILLLPALLMLLPILQKVEMAACRIMIESLNVDNMVQAAAFNADPRNNKRMRWSKWTGKVLNSQGESPRPLTPDRVTRTRCWLAAYSGNQPATTVRQEKQYESLNERYSIRHVP